MWGERTSSRGMDMKVGFPKLPREERRTAWFRVGWVDGCELGQSGGSVTSSCRQAGAEGVQAWIFMAVLPVTSCPHVGQCHRTLEDKATH